MSTAQQIELAAAERIAAMPLSNFFELILIAPGDTPRRRRVYIADSRGSVSVVTCAVSDFDKLSWFRNKIRAQHGYAARHRTELALSRVAGAEWRAEIARASERYTLIVKPRVAELEAILS